MKLPKAKITFKHWWEDYIKDIAKTASRLEAEGVSHDKIEKIMRYQVKELISEGVEISIVEVSDS